MYKDKYMEFSDKIKWIGGFTYTYKSRKMGNTGVAKMLNDNKYRIVMRIFK